MLKKLGKKRRVLELGFALGFALTVLLTAFAAHRRQVADRVCADTVRLHILANSDTLEDQLVKLQVRDAILAALPDSVLQAGTGDSPLTVPFYEKCGFVRSHRIPNFFTDH